MLLASFLFRSCLVLSSLFFFFIIFFFFSFFFFYYYFIYIIKTLCSLSPPVFWSGAGRSPAFSRRKENILCKNPVF
ncbi:MAG TPA: hypothetical protein DCE71_02670 [Parachlamydiales bacterium]|nr:hypothetical protein [Parachlamydiales bacterium]